MLNLCGSITGLYATAVGVRQQINGTVQYTVEQQAESCSCNVMSAVDRFRFGLQQAVNVVDTARQTVVRLYRRRSSEWI